MSIDTEGPNLNRIATSLDIIQFAVDTKVGYVLPLRHYDSPFTIAEQDVIAEWLAKWFWDNQNSYHIYHNASHDSSVLMSQLKFGHNCADIWDLMAGEYALDENMSELDHLPDHAERQEGWWLSQPSQPYMAVWLPSLFHGARKAVSASTPCR